MRVEDIRNEFRRLLKEQEFVVDKTGVKVVEIVGASFVADEDVIFGTTDRSYVEREIAWYESQSRNINDIPPPVPEIWKKVATKEGLINSNYGWCTWSEENFFQYDNCWKELVANPYSRRAVMIYTRPSMWYDYKVDGMSDFICTNVVQYLIRNMRLEVVVQMRSNDAVYGYKNDVAWARHVQERLRLDLSSVHYPGLQLGDITWQVGSLHLYERHFHLA